MNEGQVSVDGTTTPLPDPFFVIATQNPQDFAGTYPLPESQLDRFMVRIKIGYPPPQVEMRLLLHGGDADRARNVPRVIDPAQLVALQREVDRVEFDASLATYLQAVLAATRSTPTLSLGASPRAGMNLARAARGRAVLHGRSYCIADDIHDLAVPVPGAPRPPRRPGRRLRPEPRRVRDHGARSRRARPRPALAYERSMAKAGRTSQKMGAARAPEPRASTRRERPRGEATARDRHPAAARLALARVRPPSLSPAPRSSNAPREAPAVRLPPRLPASAAAAREAPHAVGESAAVPRLAAQAQGHARGQVLPRHHARRGLRGDQHRQQPALPAAGHAALAHARLRRDERPLAPPPHGDAPPPRARPGRPRPPRRDRGLQPQEKRPLLRDRGRGFAGRAARRQALLLPQDQPLVGAGRGLPAHPGAARARSSHRLSHRHALPLRPLREIARGRRRGRAHHLPRGRRGAPHGRRVRAA